MRGTFKPENLGGGWYTNPDGGASRLSYPKGPLGPCIVSTIPPDRFVYPFTLNETDQTTPQNEEKNDDSQP